MLEEEKTIPPTNVEQMRQTEEANQSRRGNIHHKEEEDEGTLTVCQV